jgi:hypothetical protein
VTVDLTDYWRRQAQRIRCCGRFCYWQSDREPLTAIWGRWTCTECERTLTGHPPAYVLEAYVAAVAALPPITYSRDEVAALVELLSQTIPGHTLDLGRAATAENR